MPDQHRERQHLRRRRRGHGRGEPQERHGRQREPDLRKDVDVPGMRDEAPGDRRRCHLRQRDRQQQRAGRADSHAAPELQVQRHVEDHRKQRAAEAQHDGVGARDRGNREEVDGNDRIVVVAFPRQQRRERRGGHDEQRGHRPRLPRETVPARRQREQERRGTGAEQQRAEQVGAKRPVARRQRRMRNAQRQRGGDEAERQVDEEDRAPAEMLGQVRAEHRPHGARQREHRREVTGEASALARRHVLAEQRLRERHEAAAAQALQRPEHDEPQEARRQRAGGGGAGEDRQRPEQHPPPPEAVAQIAVERRGDRRRQQIRDDDPRKIGEAAQRGGDHRQRAGQDRLVGGRQEHRDHHTGKHPAEGFARAQRRPGVGPPWRIGTLAQWDRPLQRWLAVPGIGSNMRSST